MRADIEEAVRELDVARARLRRRYESGREVLSVLIMVLAIPAIPLVFLHGCITRRMWDMPFSHVVGTDEVQHSFPDGTTIVHLRTREALRYEGHFARHCLGDGSYDEHLVAGDRMFYSLRDASNMPLATFEVAGGCVVQAKGPRNMPVDPSVRAHLWEFFLRRRLVIVDDMQMIGLGG